MGDGDCTLDRRRALGACAALQHEHRCCCSTMASMASRRTRPRRRRRRASRATPSRRAAACRPLNPLSVSLGVTNASFVAQTAEWAPAHLYATLRAAYRHRGLTFVRVLQRCPSITSAIYPGGGAGSGTHRAARTMTTASVLPDLDKIYKKQTRARPAGPRHGPASRRVRGAQSVSASSSATRSRERATRSRQQRRPHREERIALLNKELRQVCRLTRAFDRGVGSSGAADATFRSSRRAPCCRPRSCVPRYASGRRSCRAALAAPAANWASSPRDGSIRPGLPPSSRRCHQSRPRRLPRSTARSPSCAASPIAATRRFSLTCPRVAGSVSGSVMRWPRSAAPLVR